ncbi:MAG: hypothetical protein P4L33_00595 [Capsulimonadaceae bacterium]|nr:hypothetical protein [Capsulimonadaceae bacterium]
MDFPAYRKDLREVIAKVDKEAPGADMVFGQLHEDAMEALERFAAADIGSAKVR